MARAICQFKGTAQILVRIVLQKSIFSLDSVWRFDSIGIQFIM